MTTYKDTLNLPKTSFPMKANLANREPGMLEKWHDNDIYGKLRETRKGKETFILHDGPPYANGHLHCGHALNKILKDIIVKSKSMSGFDAPFIPGWDCHGLPIELNVEKKFGKAGQKISFREFRQKCREYASSQVNIQREEFKRFGVMGDWDNPYITMDYKTEANTVRALGKIIENGHLQQGFKPVHWCLNCASALAEAEVEYDEKTSPAIDVAFNITDLGELAKRTGETLEKNASVSFVIWTTTPWTLPANEAVALNRSLEYAIVYSNKLQKYYIIAEQLVGPVMTRYGLEDYCIEGCVSGEKLEGLNLAHPFESRHVPVVLGEHVNLEAGTGCVHTAPAHGPDDYVLGKQYQLPLKNPVLATGVFAPDTFVVAGIHVSKADQAIIEVLANKEALVFQETIKHSYPHCWRHKTPVIFRATPQWFIAMDKAKLRNDCLSSIKHAHYIPEWGQARITGMVEGRPDWCISRQRAWGTPIPIFIHAQTSELHPRTNEIIEQVATLIERDGIDAWFELDVERFLGDEAQEYEKVTDTLDVWFDSGVTHYTVLDQDPMLSKPADLYLEGSDQHRGWFNSSLTTSCAINGSAPFKTALTHGYTVDAHGKKMSKSKGNYILPEKMINQYGADVLRLWVSSTDYKGDVSLSDEIFKRTSDAYRRIRNTCRFLLANLFDFEPDKNVVHPDNMVALDKWVVARLAALQQEICEAYDNYDFHHIYQKIHNFCAVDMGGFYLDIIKDRQYTAAPNGVARRSCQTAMYYTLECLVRWLAPILSFTAEEVWSFMPGFRLDSVLLSTWYDKLPTVSDVDFSYWERLRLIRDVVNKAVEKKRIDGDLGAALEAEVTLYVDGHDYDSLSSLGSELRFLLITSKAMVLSYSEDHGEQTEVEGLRVEVKPSKKSKCERCWHRVGSVGESEQYPTLCVRCVGNLSGDGESRVYA